MRTIAAVALVLAIMPSARAQNGPFTIQRGAVGPVSIGASAEAINALFPAERRHPVNIPSEDGLVPALGVTLPGSSLRDGLVIEFIQRGSRREVWRMTTTDPAVRTAKGIGVGSTVADLRAAHRIAWVGTGEGHVFMYVEELGAGFELEQAGSRGSRLSLIKEPAQVPGDVRISGVVITLPAPRLQSMASAR